MIRALRRFSLRRRRYLAEGVGFINQVLATLGRPLLTIDDYRAFVTEVKCDRLLAQRYEYHLPFLRTISPSKPIESWEHRFEWGNGLVFGGIDALYILPRVLQPALVVETGVASGSMTGLLLAALHRNERGSLVSVDLPPQNGRRSMDWSLPADLEIGFLIPNEYRDRWSLIRGDATYELPRLFEVDGVDFFVHDSDHTVAHMMFEYSVAAKHVKRGGIIVSDDILRNDAFFSFFELLGWPIVVNKRNPNIGLAVAK